ncbi:MAG: alpha/beta fold hydrolase [Prevotella sp.]
MYKSIIMVAAVLFGGSSFASKANAVSSPMNNITLQSDLMTPEALWAMGRIGTCVASPDGSKVVYQVSYYNVKENKSTQVLYLINTDGSNKKLLTPVGKKDTDPAWIENGKSIAFLSEGQLWKMNVDGTNRVKLTNDSKDIEGFLFSPNEKQVILIKSIPYHGTIEAKPADLPLTTGMVINDMNYRHWDHYVQENLHPFLADVAGNSINEGKDILEGEPYECPMAPFGGVEQLAWSPDSKTIAYTCRKKEGVNYAISTDSDIFLYTISTRQTRNLCKPADYKEPAIDASKTMKNQAVNHQSADYNVGYDTNPKFSFDGKYIAWQSMKNNGYESDRNRLCVYELATGKKNYVTEKFDSNIDEFCWAKDNKTLYFIGCWHATVQVYQTNLKGEVKKLTDGVHDCGGIQLLGNQDKLLAKFHSMSHPDDLFVLNLKDKKNGYVAATQVTDENKHIFSQLSLGAVEDRWVTTTDGKKMQVWVILPPHFDPNKKYPTILFCEGGPQSPVSQFWSYRWNFQIMAANGYVVIAPNRRGLPGYGSEWNEKVSGDWTGQCMNDYLSAIDDAANNFPYVDKDRLGCVGASFGGFSVYYLAGHHNKRFKAFISHDGAFNLESMYTDTEEAWFSNWEYKDAYWNKDQTENARRTYENSPHRFIDKWDTPILCIHGEKDYRINANQGFGAFNAARLKGIPAQLLLFPDENHWVLKPQNGILWQRTFFNWLDKWLKN